MREQIDRLKHEVDMLRALDHPFITPLHAAFQDARRFYLVFEFLQGGELYFHHRSEADTNTTQGKGSFRYTLRVRNVGTCESRS